MNYEHKILELQAELQQAHGDLERERQANSKFRLLMLSDANDVPSVDQIYLAQMRTNWSLLPVETLLTFLDLYQSHANIFAEIIHEKKGKVAIKEYNDKQAKNKIKAAQDYRDRITEEAELSSQSQIPAGKVKGAKKIFQQKYNISESDALELLKLPKDQRRVIQGMMKTLGITDVKAAIEALNHMKIKRS